VHERYRRQTTDDRRQTDRRQTDGRATAYSEREREFTFAKNKPSFTRKRLMLLSYIRVHLQLMQSQNWLPWQRPLDPRSRLCLHWTRCLILGGGFWGQAIDSLSPKLTPRIKQRVAIATIQLKL